MDLPDLARSRAVLIGNGAYAEHPRIPNLPGAQACVQAMSALLTGPLCGWPNDRITPLVDLAVPSELAVRAVEAVRDAEDLLLVYYVGHGMRTFDGQLALGLAGTRAHPEMLRHTAMLYPELASILRGSRARTKLVILDCCHAELGHRANYIFQSADLAEAYPVDGLYFIGASARDAKAKAPAGGGLTYFTDAFVTTVTTGIPRQPPTLRLDQIFLELRARLLRANLPEPVEAGTRGAHQYPFARNAAPQELLLDPDAEIARLLRETADAEARERALREEQAGELRHLRERRIAFSRRGVLVTAAAVALGSGIAVGILLAPDPPAPAQALGPPLTGFSGSVTAVAFAPDGHTLVTGDDKSVRLWDTTNPADPTALGSPLDGNNVAAVAFAPDGHTLATGERGDAKLWDATDPAHPTALGSPLDGNNVAAVAFAPDGHTLATGEESGVRLWNVTDPRNPALLGSLLTGLNFSVISVAFTPDGRTLGICDSSQVQLWNITNLAKPAALAAPQQGGADSYNSVAFVDGRTLAAGDGATFSLYDITNPANPTLTGWPQSSAPDTVTSIAFTPRGRTLAVGASNGTVQLWNITDPANPTALGSPLTGLAGSVTSVAFTPDGRTLAASADNGTVQLWAIR